MKKTLVLIAVASLALCACSKKCGNGELKCEDQCLVPAMAHLMSCSACEIGYCDMDGNLLNGCEGKKAADGQCVALGADAVAPAADAAEPGAAADPAVKPADATGALTLGAEFFEKTQTLTDRGDGIDYVLENDLDVNNYTLTIEPGVTIAIKNQGVTINIGDGGAIQAKGTAEKPIVIKAGGSAPGGAINIAENANHGVTHTLSYVNFKNMGDAEYKYIDGVVRIESNVKASMDHVTIDGARKNGIIVYGELVKFENNTIKNCERSPLWINNPDNVSNLGDGNVYENNKLNYIELTQANQAPSNSQVTFNKQSVPWLVTEGMEWSADKTTNVTIPAGSEFVFPEGKSAIFSGKFKVVMNGTAEAPITFKSQSDDVAWNGILFSGSDVTMQYVNVLKTNVDQYFEGALTFSYYAKAKLDHVLIDDVNNDSDGKGYGIYASDAKITVFENNTIKNTSNFPLSIEKLDDLVLGDGNTFAANADRAKKNYVEVRDESFRNEVDAYTFKKLGVPYLLNGLYLENADVTVEAGTILAMRDGRTVNIREKASLNVAGTAESRVVFQGYNGDKWDRFTIANKKASSFHFVDIKDTSDVALSIEEVEGGNKVALEQVTIGEACVEKLNLVELAEGTTLKACAE